MNIQEVWCQDRVQEWSHVRIILSACEITQEKKELFTFYKLLEKLEVCVLSESI